MSWLFSHYSYKVEYLHHRPYHLQNLTCLLSGPLQRKFTYLCFRPIFSVFPFGPEIKYTKITTGDRETEETLKKLFQEGQHTEKIRL